MHLLNRHEIDPPVCLQGFRYPEQRWDDLTSSCKRELRARLVQMQGIPDVSTAPEANEYGLRCAYCESEIYGWGGHIEHFRRKNPAHFPELTFEWTNLFLACGSGSHCGHYKDNSKSRTYDPNDLVKPDTHDPDEYLFFHSSGEVRARAGASDEQRRIAEETIRVFNLNEPALKARRRTAVKAHRESWQENLEVLAEFSAEELADYLDEEIEQTRYQAFATAIRHFFESAS